MNDSVTTGGGNEMNAKRKGGGQSSIDDIKLIQTSIHRRPVKKRHVMLNDEASLPVVTVTTATTIGLPDLVHETNGNTDTGTGTATEHTNTAVDIRTTTPSTTAPSVDSNDDNLMIEKTMMSVSPVATLQSNMPLLPTTIHHPDKHGVATTNEKDPSNDMVPSPPLLLRSVAQVFGHNNTIYIAHPGTSQQQQLPIGKFTPPSPATTTATGTPSVPTEYQKMHDAVTQLLPMSPSQVKLPHHRRSLALVSYDSQPPIDDMVASLSLSTSTSSLSKKYTTANNETSMSSYKNHNKVLPKRHLDKNATTDDEDDYGGNHEIKRNIATAKAPSKKAQLSDVDKCSDTSKAKYPLHNSDQMEVTATDPPIPPALMSGKVISTKYGLAMLVVPSSDITVSDYTDTFASTTTMHGGGTSSHAASSTSTNGTTTAMTTRFKHWLKSEDELLQYAISKQEDGPPYMWQQIAQTYFPNTRNANQCKSRWKKIDPSVAKNAFTAEEDAIILKGEKDGLSWPAIANQLPGRNSDQVRFRFVNTINPLLMKNVGWTNEEERILQKAQSELGNKWSVIASFLPGRSENDIKNHWHNQRLRNKRKLKAMAAHMKRDETLMNLRNGIYDRDVPSQNNTEAEDNAVALFTSMDTTESA